MTYAESSFWIKKLGSSVLTQPYTAATEGARQTQANVIADENQNPCRDDNRKSTLNF